MSKIWRLSHGIVTKKKKFTSLSKLKKQILNQYKWREEYKPENIRFKDLKSYHESTFITHGKDKEGNPVQYLMLKNFHLDGSEEQIEEKFREMVYNYELNTRMLQEPDVFQITTIVELIDGSISMNNGLFFISFLIDFLKK